MTKKARLGLYLESDLIKRQIKIAAAKRGISASDYCTQAIEAQLKKDMSISDQEARRAHLAKMDALSQITGSLGITTADLVKQSRRPD